MCGKKPDWLASKESRAIFVSLVSDSQLSELMRSYSFICSYKEALNLKNLCLGSIFSLWWILLHSEGICAENSTRSRLARAAAIWMFLCRLSALLCFQRG